MPKGDMIAAEYRAKIGAGKAKRGRLPRQPSALEEAFAQQVALVGLPEPVREYQFAPPRRWRFDFAWPERKIAVEVEGGIWANGRHTRGSGFEKDAVKYNEAAALGWSVYRFTSGMIDSGAALRLIEAALRGRGEC